MKQRPPRLEREPDYNKKRRIGTGSVHLPTCEACGFRIPDELDAEQGQLVPCSEFHVRCVRCYWPVERTHLSPDGLCVVCMEPSDRKRYYRRTGEMTAEKQEKYARSYGIEMPSVTTTYVRARNKTTAPVENGHHHHDERQEEMTT